MKRAMSSQAAAAKWVPRASKDTLYTIERRAWRKETGQLRRKFLEERRSAEAAKASERAEEQAAVEARRTERLRRRRELAAIRQQEMAEELRQIQAEKARRKELNRQHKERVESLERAKSIFAVETLEEEKYRWIASEEDLTPERMMATKMPPGFSRPKFRVLYGDWELPWEMQVDENEIDTHRPASRAETDDKKKPIPPVAQPVDGVNDLPVPEALDAIVAHYRKQHDHMASRGLVAPRSRVKLQRDTSVEEAEAELAASKDRFSDFVAFAEENPFASGGDLEAAVRAAQGEGAANAEEDDDWSAAR